MVEEQALATTNQTGDLAVAAPAFEVLVDMIAETAFVEEMMDRITDISEDGGEHGKGHVVAEFDITPDLWFFKCHFPGNPIMPGCLGLDGLWQLTGFNLGWRGWQGRGYALGVGEDELVPDDAPFFRDYTWGSAAIHVPLTVRGLGVQPLGPPLGLRLQVWVKRGGDA